MLFLIFFYCGCFILIIRIIKIYEVSLEDEDLDVVVIHAKMRRCDINIYYIITKICRALL